MLQQKFERGGVIMTRKVLKGFTSLIIIAIAGILLLPSPSAARPAPAEASNIASGLRSIIFAAHLFIADNMDDAARFTGEISVSSPNFGGVPAPEISHLDALVAHMDNPGSMANFALVINEADGGWWVRYNFPNAPDAEARWWWVRHNLREALCSRASSVRDTQRRLAARATSVGLFSAMIPMADLADTPPNFTSGASVFMFVGGAP
jgi:hypothetical protein